MIESVMPFKFTFDGGTSCDAEIQAIQIIPQVLKPLKIERRKAVLRYILERYEDGDNFGIE